LKPNKSVIVKLRNKGVGVKLSNPHSLHLTKVVSKTTDRVLREVDYQYDKFDNAVRQEITFDGSESYVNTYLYDALDRLDQASLDGQNVDYSYDAFSNLKTKSGISNMVYD
jgi:hypothetical protein